jgi:hypothetical protein
VLAYNQLLYSKEVSQLLLKAEDWVYLGRIFLVLSPASLVCIIATIIIHKRDGHTIKKRYRRR